MQADTPHAYPSTLPAVSLTGALRAVETLLLGGGQRTARSNAWSAVVEDRQRAKDRRDAQHLIEALAASPITRNAGPEPV